MTGLNILFIDNFDSFVFNLVDEFEKRGASVEVWRNDTPTEKALEIVDAMPAPRLVVLSPGPGTPATAGNCCELVQTAPLELPVFGVCLGHQAIIEALGGKVGGADEIVHGKPGLIEHDGRGLFEGLPMPITAGRYHSLVGLEIPEALEVTARLGNKVMAVEHVSRRITGVQFHPESILTPYGGRLIENVIRWAAK